jgi:sec-independent protein translocase protein TatB
MLPEAGAFELIFLAAVALIVVGPKDLPVLLRKVGQFVSKMRGLAAEFRASFDELARQSELDELRKEVEALRNHQIQSPVMQEIEAEFDHFQHGLQPQPLAPPPVMTALTAETPAIEPALPVDPHTVNTVAEPVEPAAPAPEPKRARKPAGAAAPEPGAEPEAGGDAKPKRPRKPKPDPLTEQAG